MPRLRRKFAILLSIIVLTVIMLLYVLINQSMPAAKLDNYTLIESKLLALEHGFSRHSDQVGKIQRDIDTLKYEGAIADGNSVAESPVHQKRVHSPSHDNALQHNDAAVAAGAGTQPQCPISGANQPPPANITVQMLRLYDEMPFDNLDGGAWKQGWRLSADEHDWNAHHPLRVFVVPHSHNDPGWLKTFDEYYEQSTKSILTNMLYQMRDNPAQTFIWAEISYFARWFENLAPADRRSVRQLVTQGRLEFVTGGWVMADEANSHWLSLLQQLTEGHTWLRHHLNVTPTASWSIDPFGTGATMPLLLKHAGLADLLIQRAHYSVKKRLASTRQLEFRWRQLWDTVGGTELFTQLMPFYSYDVPHTCGPDPKVCCQFDFKRLPGYGLHCPWNVPPRKIDAANVAERAELLLDQWRKKAGLFRTRALLVPLGDDFRYSQTTEWEEQRGNYQRIFDYLNGEARLHVSAKFATLGEYFAAVHEEKRVEDFPTFSGDFFTYADRDDHYWSGYYTSRPYHKRLDRLLMTYLRSAELMHSWSRWPKEAGVLEVRLQRARRALSLFQHHDGVTGTGREHVMRDYARQLDAALQDCRHVMQQAAYRHLTEAAVYNADYEFTYFHVDDGRLPPATAFAPAAAQGDDEEMDSVAVDSRPTIILGKELPTKYVVVHNGLAQVREELVEVLVSKPTVRVTDQLLQPIPAQVAQVWTWHRDANGGAMWPQASTTKYRLVWLARVPPLGMRTYVVHSTATVEEAMDAATMYARVELHADQLLGAPAEQQGGNAAEGGYPHAVRMVNNPQEVSLHVDDGVAASFTRTGQLKSMRVNAEDESVGVHLSFVRYGARRGQERSGAYLFLPDGGAVEMPLGGEQPAMLVERGELESRCTVGLPHVVHETVLRGAAAGGVALEIRNLVDIRRLDNVEVAMRLQSAIGSGDVFYTDMNGMQLVKRRRLTKLPLQANYYPVPSQIYIEDERYRLTLLTAQPLGGSSLAGGQMELMQDRRMQFDDNRGLGQGVLDNRPVLNVFRLVLEPVADCAVPHPDRPDGQLTALAHGVLQAMLHPVEKLIWYETEWAGVRASFGDEREPMEEDVEVAVVRSLAQVSGKVADGKKMGKRAVKAIATTTTTASGIVLHRTHLRACTSDVYRAGTFNLRRTFGLADDQLVHTSRITLLQRDAPVNAGDDLDICPMDIKAFIVSR